MHVPHAVGSGICNRYTCAMLTGLSEFCNNTLSCVGNDTWEENKATGATAETGGRKVEKETELPCVPYSYTSLT